MPTIRSYNSLATLPPHGPLPPSIGVILPLARTNLVTNPSFELATTDWAGRGGFTAITRSAVQQYHGTYSLAVLPDSGANDGAYYQGALTLTAGTTYAISAKVFGLPGHKYQLAIATSSNVTLQSDDFVATGRWQWRSLIYQERTTAARHIGVWKNNSTDGDYFYVDGVQCEAITDGILQATTYIDGAQLGLLPGQQPPPYGWNGAPHASTSYRTVLTRAGGYLVNLQTVYGFMLTGMIGLGMAAPNNVSIPYSVLDGARYVRTTKPPRTLSLPGRFQADTADQLYRYQSAMRAAFDRDAVPLQQPLRLVVEPQDDCGNVIGDFAYVQCLYAGGLEGNESNYPVEDAAPTFTMYVPFLIGGDKAAALTAQQGVTTNYVAHRSVAGVWDGLDTSLNGIVNALAIGPNGYVYAGGNFTNASGNANADYVAYWDGSAWQPLGTGTDDQVYALAFDAAGILYAAGAFANAGGVAAARIAKWNGSAWSALGTGLSGGVSPLGRALLVDSSNVLWVGGTFTDAGGSGADYFAKYDIATAAWSVVGSATAINGTVLALAEGADGDIYLGGAFTNAGGVAAADYIAAWDVAGLLSYQALTTGMDAQVQALAFGPNNVLYVGGAFTTAGGLAIPYIAQWNGTGWSGVGSLNNSVSSLFFGYGGRTLYASGDFTTANGISLPDRMAQWNGSSWLPLDIDVAGAAAIATLVQLPNGEIYVGLKAAGAGVRAANTTVVNSNPGISYPVVTITAAASIGRIYQLVNYTTGQGIWLSLFLSPGEVATLIFDPSRQSFTSTFQGDITNKMLPGSNLAQFYLAPGDNVISFFASQSATTAVMGWQKRYNGGADLVSP